MFYISFKVNIPKSFKVFTEEMDLLTIEWGHDVMEDNSIQNLPKKRGQVYNTTVYSCSKFMFRVL